MRTRRQDDLTSIRNAICCQTRISYVLYTSFSFWIRCTFATRMKISYRGCDEEMHNAQLVLTLLKIISLISMVYQSTDIITLSIV